LRGAELHGRLEVMGLARYYSSTPRWYFILSLFKNQPLTYFYEDLWQ